MVQVVAYNLHASCNISCCFASVLSWGTLHVSSIAACAGWVSSHCVVCLQELAAPLWVSIVAHAAQNLDSGNPAYWALWPASMPAGLWGILVATFYAQVLSCMISVSEQCWSVEA